MQCSLAIDGQDFRLQTQMCKLETKPELLTVAKDFIRQLVSDNRHRHNRSPPLTVHRCRAENTKSLLTLHRLVPNELPSQKASPDIT